MRIIDLAKNPPITPKYEHVSTAAYLQSALKAEHTVHHLSHELAALPRTEDVQPTSSLLFAVANQCYDLHLPFALSPEVIWFTILHEVSAAVKEAPNTYAHLYTRKPDEQQIVRVFIDDFIYGKPNDWTAGIAQFEAKLKEFVPDGIQERSILRFSTSTPVTDVATLLTFMDAASPFFDYRMMTRCGIPQIRLEGTTDDWRAIRQNAASLSEVFTDLGAWFASLLPVLDKLVATAEGDVDPTFWSNMYKVEDHSGGPYIDGWMTCLVAHTITYKGTLRRREKFEWGGERRFGGPLTTAALPSHVGSTPFIWEYLGSEIPMRFAAGVLGSDVVEGFYTPRLGFAVLEPAK